MSVATLSRSLRTAFLVLAFSMASQAPSFAQALAAIVNGDPITTTEVDEQIKYRRLTHQSASRPEAIEDLIADRIKLRAANREGVDASDASFAQALNQIAIKAKTNSQALIQQFQNAKLNIDLVRSHVRAVASWNDFVKARYKALNVSQSEIDAAIAKDGSHGDTSYTLQQIIVVVPVGASPAVVADRAREAQGLRARFEDCGTGIALARGLPDVAIKPAYTKTSSSLNEAARKSLEQAKKGRLTEPSRSATGFEMIAVCNKSDETDTSSLRETVQANLLTERLSKESDRMYQELRARAVVEKR